jgi:hypothetical protein
MRTESGIERIVIRTRGGVWGSGVGVTSVGHIYSVVEQEVDEQEEKSGSLAKRM